MSYILIFLLNMSYCLGESFCVHVDFLGYLLDDESKFISLWSFSIALYDFCFTGVNEIFLHDLICGQYSFVSVPDWGECSLLCSMFYFIPIRSNSLIILFKYSVFLLFVYLFYMLVPESCVVRNAQKFMCYIFLANTSFCPFSAFV